MSVRCGMACHDRPGSHKSGIVLLLFFPKNKMERLLKMTTRRRPRPRMFAVPRVKKKRMINGRSSSKDIPKSFSKSLYLDSNWVCSEARSAAIVSSSACSVPTSYLVSLVESAAAGTDTVGAGPAREVVRAWIVRQPRPQANAVSASTRSLPPHYGRHRTARPDRNARSNTLHPSGLNNATLSPLQSRPYPPSWSPVSVSSSFASSAYNPAAVWLQVNVSSSFPHRWDVMFPLFASHIRTVVLCVTIRLLSG